MNTECCFCEEYAHPLDSQYYDELGREIGVSSRVLMETEHWYAVPTLGCFTRGYILLVCKQHYQSAANLSFDLYQEMLELKKRIERIIYKKLGLRCMAFEHGTTSSFFTGANSVDHVHLHIVPCTRKVWPDISKKYNLTDFEAVDSYEKLFFMWMSHYPKTYLLFQDSDSIIYYRKDAGGFPSQFFRKCLAPFFNADKWDWKKEFYQGKFIDTLKLFKS